MVGWFVIWLVGGHSNTPAPFSNKGVAPQVPLAIAPFTSAESHLPNSPSLLQVAAIPELTHVGVSTPSPSGVGPSSELPTGPAKLPLEHRSFSFPLPSLLSSPYYPPILLSLGIEPRSTPQINLLHKNICLWGWKQPVPVEFIGWLRGCRGWRLSRPPWLITVHAT